MTAPADPLPLPTVSGESAGGTDVRRQFELATRLASLGSWDGDLLTGRVSWSAELWRIFGLEPRVKGLSLDQLLLHIHPDDRARFSAAIEDGLRDAVPFDLEFRIVRPDGLVRHLHGREEITRDDNGRPIRFFGVAQDITARKHAEAALRAREREFRTLAEHTPDFIVRWDRELRRRYVNPAFATFMGMIPDELLAKPFGEYPGLPAPPDATMLAPVRAAIQQVFATGRPAELATPWQASGRSIFIHLHLIPEFDDEGRLATVLSLGRDITAFQQTTERLRTLIDSLDGILWEADPTTFRFTFVSPQAERILGHPIACWLTEPDFWERHLHPDDRNWAMNYCLTCTRAGQDHEFDYRMVAADGRVVWLHDRVTFVSAEGDRPARLRGLMVDITLRKQIEQALSESEQRFRQVVEAIDEIFWLDDATTGTVIYISPACEKIWGRPCDSLRATPHAWLDTVHPDDRARVAALVRQRGDRSYDTEYRIIRPDGTVRHIREKAFPIRDEGGRVFRIAGVAEDVTARCELADQLRQSQKMEAIGRLAGGVAHDFNNLLTAIQLQTDLLQREPSASPVWNEGVVTIQQISRRAAALTRQLLTFSRRQTKQARPLSLRDVLDGMRRLIEPLLGENVRIVRRAPSVLPDVHADLGMMEQVIMNLLVNARDALPEIGGEIAVSLTLAEITAANSGPLSRPGRFVCLAVADTGCGIPPENLSRIFEPFYTTKESGKGTGLGLATAYGIVQEHQGWIEVESTVGHGTAFRVFLPALDRPTTDDDHPTPSPGAPGGRESILLVEDLAHVRVPTEALLRRLGYQVSAAASAADALQVWDEMGGRCDLLLTDLAMPGGMNGLQLARELHRRQPTLRVLYTSGYRSPTQPGAELLKLGEDFLPKPYSLEELSQAVRQKLDEASDRTPALDSQED